MSKEKELFQKLFPDVEITEESNVDELAEQLSQKQRDKFYEVFKNDPGEVKDEIIKHTEGKLHGSLNTRLKKFGLNPDDLDGKTISEKMELLESQVDEKIKTASKKEVSELQTELANYSKKIEEFEEKIIPDIKEKNAKEVKDIYVNLDLAKKYGDIDNSMLVNGKEGRKTAIKMLDFELKDTYDIGKDEAGNLVFYEKNSQKRAMDQKKTRILDADEVIMSTLKGIGLYKMSSGSAGTAGTGGGGQQQPNGKTLTPEAEALLKSWQK